jgi:hypothetical protein
MSETNNIMYLAEALELCPKESEYREQVELAVNVLAIAFGHFHVFLHSDHKSMSEVLSELPEYVLVEDVEFKKVENRIMERTLLGRKRYFAIYEAVGRSAEHCSTFIMLKREQFRPTRVLTMKY